MARSDEAEAFFYGVYAAVQEIPYGKVTTYGHIAALVGTRSSIPLRYEKERKKKENKKSFEIKQLEYLISAG